MGIAKAQEARAARVAAGLPAVKTPEERVWDDPKSLRKAVDANCWECQGRDSDPCVKWRIGNCQIKECFMWPHRPHQTLYGKPEPAALKNQFTEA